ncbi:DUF3592 domain-containing protein [Kribbella lupini]|uniref:DUF3592 domain-containing protein n=1 Tax=Kribbella lupini TaxID=291602 RepID=A0ABP4MG77_9ACTN
MGTNVDWPGRGPTWLGVPALVVALVGVLMLAEVSHREGFTKDLLANGTETVASSVQVSVGRGGISNPVVVFRTTDGREIRTELSDAEVNDDEGMPDGQQTPAAGTRYAPPLKIVYRPSDPTVALALVDAGEWVADQHTARRGRWMITGGLAVTLIALAGLTRGARRRGLAWWQWYTAAPPPPQAPR